MWFMAPPSLAPARHSHYMIDSRKLTIEKKGMAERERKIDILNFCPHASPCQLNTYLSASEKLA